MRHVHQRWIMTAAAFLEKNPKPTEAQFKEALTGIKCRCGTHMSIMRALLRAHRLEGGEMNEQINRRNFLACCRRTHSLRRASRR